MSKSSNKSKYHVPNLERALKIIELLAHYPEGLTTSQIAEMLNLPRNSVYRITATLEDTGYLVRDEETKAFELTQKLLSLGYTALTDETMVERSLGVMRNLRDQFGETALLGILHGTEGIVIEEVQGTHSFRFVFEPGRRLDLHTSAPGKTLVAFLPKSEREALLRKIEFTRYNERTISNSEQYRTVLQEVRKCGYAVDIAEKTEGMHCIAAPILNRHGYPAAAIWISGPSFRVKEEDFPKIGEEVKRHANRISKSLGYGLTFNVEKEDTVTQEAEAPLEASLRSDGQ